MHTGKAKQGIHLPLSMGRQVVSNPQERRAPLHVKILKKVNTITPNCPLFQPILYAEHMAQNIPWVCCGQLSHLSPLSSRDL